MENKAKILVSEIYFLAGFVYFKVKFYQARVKALLRKIYFLARFARYKAVEYAYKSYIKFILWGLFRPYHEGLAAQAKYLYEQTPLYEERKKLFGVGFAKRSFEENDATFFMWKARQEPRSVKWQIFKNAFWCRPLQPVKKEIS